MCWVKPATSRLLSTYFKARVGFYRMSDNSETQHRNCRLDRIRCKPRDAKLGKPCLVLWKDMHPRVCECQVEKFDNLVPRQASAVSGPPEQRNRRMLCTGR